LAAGPTVTASELLEPERVTALEHQPVLQGLGEELVSRVVSLLLVG